MTKLNIDLEYAITEETFVHYIGRQPVGNELVELKNLIKFSIDRQISWTKIIIEAKQVFKKEKIVAVSGGFDPLHIGHVRLMQEAKKLGSKLYVILNNDNWLNKKKGYAFMSQDERAEIIKALGCVDGVIITNHQPNDEDRSVCRELAELHPDIFANGGDRMADNVPEAMLCKELGIEMVDNVGAGGKIQSSSDLVKRFKDIKGDIK